MTRRTLGTLIDLDTQGSSHIADEGDQEGDADHDDGQKDDNNDCAYIDKHWALQLIWTQSSTHVADHYVAEDEDKHKDCAHDVVMKLGECQYFSVASCHRT